MTAISLISRVFVPIILLLGILTGCSRGDRVHCSTSAPALKNEGAGYELINLVGREVWATRNWTPESFADFSLPFFWFLWQKNDPRILLADDGSFLKSPGCTEGHYNYMRAFGKKFFQVVRLISVNNRVDEQGLIRRTELEKYHILRYSAGNSVNILFSPEGKRFIGVSKSLENSLGTPMLPEGWVLKSHILTEEIQVELLGNVSVMRMSNKDAYQGPLSDDINLY